MCAALEAWHLVPCTMRCMMFQVTQLVMRVQLVEAHARAADAHGLAVRSRSRGADEGAAASSGMLPSNPCCPQQSVTYLA